MIQTAMTEGADAIILDIEDSCPIAEKETGRVFARDCLSKVKEKHIGVFVRVNSLETGLTPIDISYVVAKGLDGVMLAKTETAQDIESVDKLITEQENRKGLDQRSVAIIALIETPKGVLSVQEIIRASSRVNAVAFGAGDYSREMGAGMGVTKLSPEEYWPSILFARSVIATAARAAGIDAIDTPFFGLVIDLKGLVVETEKSKLLGFSGKQLTHPRHVAPVNQTFAPPAEDIDFARRVVAAYEQAQAKGLGATSMGGKMVDFGSFKRAQSLLSLAEAIAARTAAGTQAQ
jgi:citrate lyase subunit beta/citryl-CoA lyase